MTDLLVPLYNLPSRPVMEGFVVETPLPHESPVLLEFVEKNFGGGWRAEVSMAFTRVPPRIKAAADSSTGRLLGFCCWDCTALGFLGPVGVMKEARGRGVGGALVLSVLHSMAEAGYGYAVVGGAGPVDFFRSICDARVIPGSDPGLYGRLGKRS